MSLCGLSVGCGRRTIRPARRRRANDAAHPPRAQRAAGALGRIAQAMEQASGVSRAGGQVRRRLHSTGGLRDGRVFLGEQVWHWPHPCGWASPQGDESRTEQGYRHRRSHQPEKRAIPPQHPSHGGWTGSYKWRCGVGCAQGIAGLCRCQLWRRLTCCRFLWLRSAELCQPLVFGQGCLATMLRET